MEKTKSTKPRTLFEKIWDSHIVAQEKDKPAIIYVDLHMIHEVTTPQAFTRMRMRNVGVKAPHRTIATIDHAAPTTNIDKPSPNEMAQKMIEAMRKNCKEFKIPLYDIGTVNQGIVHVIGPQ